MFRGLQRPKSMATETPRHRDTEKIKTLFVPTLHSPSHGLHGATKSPIGSPTGCTHRGAFLPLARGTTEKRQSPRSYRRYALCLCGGSPFWLRLRRAVISSGRFEGPQPRRDRASRRRFRRCRGWPERLGPRAARDAVHQAHPHGHRSAHCLFAHHGHRGSAGPGLARAHGCACRRLHHNQPTLF